MKPSAAQNRGTHRRVVGAPRSGSARGTRGTRIEEVPVLIAGAGPAGLMAAAELARHEIRPLVIERRAAQSDHPRATLISTWSMELLRRWGLEHGVREGEVEVEPRGLVCETLSSHGGMEIPLGLPSRAQSAAMSPTGPACVPQDHLELVLLHHARTLGVRAQFGAELVGVESRTEGVEAVVRDADGGRIVRARYLIGADGARSIVRRALGVRMPTWGAAAEAVSVLFHARLWALLGERRYGLYPITHPAAGGVLVPAGRGDRWIYGFTREAGTLTPSELGEQEMGRRIRLAAGVQDLELRIARIGRFTFSAQLADRFRDGRVFLAGDAAHRVTPRGGTGMNTAIRDGYDLGWKLGWVLRGWADPQLLGSYETERRPVAEHNVARSADPQGTVREAADELHVDLGGRIPHLWMHAGDGRHSTLDLLGQDLTLFVGPGWRQTHAAIGPIYGSVPVRIQRLSAISARALGIGDAGSLLVRPDGVPARVMTAAALAAA